MGSGYTVRISIRSWKKHTCLSCSCVYSYQLIREVKEKGSNPGAADIKARAEAVRVVEREVDVEPCPSCGLVQPDMVGQQRARVHLWTFWAALGLCVVVAGVRVSDKLRSDTATLGLAFLCAVAAMVATFIQIRNPNSNLSSNLQLAKTRAGTGRIRVHEPGEPCAPADALARPRPSIGQKVSFALLLAAVPCVAFPELARVQQAWPLNEGCYPGVVGPGDKTRVYLRQTARSIDGYWRGTLDVNLQVEGEGARSIPVATSTNARTWEATISAKKDSPSRDPVPELDITLLEDETLGGKSAQIEIDLDMKYPSREGASTFTTRETHIHKVVPLRIASALMAGKTYESWWWKGTLLGVSLTLAGALSLFFASRAFQRKARPTSAHLPRD